MRRRRTQAVESGGDPGPFVLAEWLERLPARYEVQPEWCTRREHEEHRRDRAYLLWLKARREAGVVPTVVDR